MARKATMPKLVPGLVPEPLWRLSGYRLLHRRVWERMRSQVFAQANGKCAVCGASKDKGMVCHEVWRYDERRGVATLTGLDLICPPCNAVEHIGRISSEVPEKVEDAVRHMASVNHQTFERALGLIQRASAVWKRRSALRWKTEVAPGLLDRFPELGVVAGRWGAPGTGERRVDESSDR